MPSGFNLKFKRLSLAELAGLNAELTAELTRKLMAERAATLSFFKKPNSFGRSIWKSLKFNKSNQARKTS